MAKPILIKKKVVIDLEIEAYSSFGLSGEALVKAVEKNLLHSLEERMFYMEGDVGVCDDPLPAFGYKFHAAGFKLK